MKIKVINSKLEDNEKEFKVRRMNFNQIIVNYPTGTGLKNFLFEDVKCIRENEIDDFLIDNRQFLKIRLKRGISVVFYSALKESLKSEIGEDIVNLDILKDKYKINKRGIWEKYILIFINKIFPLEVIASGENFKKDSYNIIINKIETENFLEICHEEVDKINKEIEERNVMLSMLRDVISNVKNTYKIYQ